MAIAAKRKEIIEVERFNHVAKIRQKKRSEDLVKVERTNLQQFERTTMLRNNLEVAMLYEIHLNDKEMDCDDHMYEFQRKIDRLELKLEELGRVVEQKQIPVSSNKLLLVLR